MSVVLPFLLYLGNLPRPNITAEPASMVLSKDSVTILCQGIPEAEACNISKVGGHEPMDSILPLPKETCPLRIPELTPDWAGQYHCSYQSGGQWSQPSAPLLLVMTGAYYQPSLSSMTGTVVASGDNVQLQCFSKIRFDVFILIKEDGVHITQNLSYSTPERNGHQAIFHMDPTSTQMGTYRCYGAFCNDPYVWSHPSDQLQLVAKEAPDDPDPSEPRCSTDATRTDEQPEAAEPMDGQASEDPKEVTYSQLTFSVPTQGTAGTPSFLPRQTQISEYETLALR
ncbi:leukocyte immunoglobulin-like receptor subfamily B member 4 isoform 3-T3 [Hipposideros larvatus]